MKLVSYMRDSAACYGVIVGSDVIEASGQLRYPTLRSALTHLDELQELISRPIPRYPLADLQLLPPITDPPRIMCVGRNFKKAMKTLGLESLKYPVLFARYSHGQVGHNQALVRPKVSISLDYEGELAVVIGRGGHHVPREEALQHVAGYTCFNDGSVRDYQRHTSESTPGKNFWRSGAAGPWLTTSDEIADPVRLHLTTRVNGVQVQEGSMDDLLFDVPQVIAYVSSLFPLEPGDMLAMGTPYGVGTNFDPPRWLVPGDVVSVEITEIGTLSNPVIDESDLDALQQAPVSSMGREK